MLFSCENDLEVIKTVTATLDLPKQSAEDIEVIYTDSSKIKIKITAPKLELFEESDEKSYYEFPEGIKVYFYNPDHTIKSKLSANFAIHYFTEDLWEARINVVAINQSGEILKTEQLFWDQKMHKIYTDKFAKVIDDKSQIIGQGFEADESFDTWEFKKVTGNINIDNE